MLGCNVKFWYSKKYKEFEIKEYDSVKKTQKTLINFRVGDLKNGIYIRCYDYHKIQSFFYEKYKGEFREYFNFDSVHLNVKSTRELHDFLKILEDLQYFGERIL
ncbi:hypothetical protein D3C81_662660 [compost metagenome]